MSSSLIFLGFFVVFGYGLDATIKNTRAIRAVSFMIDTAFHTICLSASRYHEQNAKIIVFIEG